MRHVRLFAPALALSLLATLATVSLAGAQATATTVTLTSQNNSGLSGTATLTDLGDGRTRVEVRVTGPEGNYPAHIHEGTCADLNPAPQHPLANVQGGTSTTEVNASLTDVEQSPHAINLHKSPQDLPTYVACGNIELAGARAGEAGPGPGVLPRTGDLPAVGSLAAAAGVALIGAGYALRRRVGR